jgi:hypothetical protein
MIGDLALAVRAELRARKYPYPVEYGPERAQRDSFAAAVVFERDRESPDEVAIRIVTKNETVESPFIRKVSGAVTVYARSAKPAARAADHENECDRVCDAVLCALYRVLKAKRLPLEVVESRMLREEDLPEGAGERAASWPGAAARIRFRVTTLVRDVNYLGEGPATAEVAAVNQPTLDVDYAPGDR